MLTYDSTELATGAIRQGGTPFLLKSAVSGASGADRRTKAAFAAGWASTTSASQPFLIIRPPSPPW